MTSTISQTADTLVTPEMVALFDAIRSHLSPIQFRETMTAVVGWKVARIALPEHPILAIVPVLRDFGLAVAISEDSYIHRPDVGKGGWSNTHAEVVTDGSGRGDYYVYIAKADAMMLTAVEAEGDGDNEIFGDTLGIPQCCREAYAQYINIARTKQNDVTPITAHRTVSRPPHSGWNNIAAQYFGASLISFAPCSLECSAAQAISRTTFELIHSYDPNLAEWFYNCHFSNIIYSERDGIHWLKESVWIASDELAYDPACVQSTADGPLAETLSRGNRLRPKSPQSFELVHNDVSVSVIDSPEIALFLCRGN
jgi:hypothetical protein